MHDAILLLAGMFIGIFSAVCIAAGLIYLDQTASRNDKLVKKFAWAVGIDIDEARKILDK